jgi:putative hydrolase of the HAD superfamily
MKKYKCVLFDLDHTLWDYESNASEALLDLYHQHQMAARGATSFADFAQAFFRINNALWDQYDAGKIHRDVIRQERFHLVFQAAGVNDYALSLQFSDDYVRESPKKRNLIADALPVLDYLQAKYPMFIITNGFEEIQGLKVSAAGLSSYFKSIVTSERAGSKKPSKAIFEYVLTRYGFRASEAIMVGDNLQTDIQGAINADIDPVFFNPARLPCQLPIKYDIASLLELKNIL